MRSSRPWPMSTSTLMSAPCSPNTAQLETLASKEGLLSVSVRSEADGGEDTPDGEKPGRSRGSEDHRTLCRAS